MPVGRGGTLNGPFLVAAGIAPFIIYRVTVGTASPLVIGAAAVGQVTAIVWLGTRSLAVWYRGILTVAALAAVTAAMLRMELSARLVGLAVGGACHAVAYVCLLTWFAASLRPGREPVVTGLARRIRRTMPDKVMRYTRRVTIAWCVFFAMQLGVSAGLLIMAPAAVWSSFVNLWNLPLAVAMILAEYSVRVVLFWREPRTGLIATLAGMRHIRGTLGSGP